MLNELDSVYMIIVKDNSTGEVFWHKTRRGYTPFTTTNYTRAKGELTICSNAYNICELVKVSNVETLL